MPRTPHHPIRRALLGAALIGLADAAHAQDTKPADPPAGSVLSPPPESLLVAPAPMTDEFDWMQFTNGEWLKGELIDLQDDSFEFESDELDKLQLDLEDIQVFFSPNPNSVLLNDKRSFTGKVTIVGNTVTVTEDNGTVHSFQRSEVRSVIPGTLRERNYWSGSLGFGTTVRRGNVNQTDVTASLLVQRKDLQSRFNIDYRGSFSAVDGITTADNHRGNIFYDRFITPRFFWRTVSLTAFRDQFQNIDIRLLPSTGFGYDLVENNRLDWYVGAAAGWEYTRFFEPLPGQSEDQSLAALVLNTKLDWEATSKIDVGFEYSITLPPGDIESYNWHTAFTTEIDIWGDFDFEIAVIWDRVNNPAPTTDGTPDKDDFRITLGIAWEF